MIKEKITEFFKLTKKKIILIFFLNIIAFFILTSYILLNHFGLYVGSLQVFWDLFLSVPLRLSSFFLGFGLQIPRWIYYILSLMVYWYFLSCLIIWVYDMVKKNEQTKNKS